MKKLHQSFDIDSHSTQEKQKRFCRKSPNKSPRENSNKSGESSMSNFYVKNLKTAVSSQTIKKVLSSRISTNSQWSPPRRKPTPSKSKSELEQAYTKEKSLESKQREIKDLQLQIERYGKYTKKQNQKYEEVVKKLHQIQQDNEYLKNKQIQYQQKIKILEQNVQELNKEIIEKDILLDMLQKQKSCLNRIKTTIHQTRTIQLQKQKQQLQSHIKQLQQQLKNNHPKSPLTITPTPTPTTPTTPTSSKSPSKYNKQNIEYISNELHKTQELVKKLQLSQVFIQRKYFMDIQMLKEKKDKQYLALKKKFMELLAKYKVNMKKIVDQKIQNFRSGRLDGRGEGRHSRSGSLESIDSLVLSQDE